MLDARRWLLEVCSRHPSSNFLNNVARRHYIAVDFWGTKFMLTRNMLNRLGCLFATFLVTIDPAFSQTVKIRLFEIFHPQGIEITSGSYHPLNGLSAHLVVCSAQDTLLRTDQTVRIMHDA